MTIKVGDKLPDVTLSRMGNDGVEPVSVSSLTAGWKMVLFAVPGAFTPTCSARHLPGFVESTDALSDKGIDSVACVSVNDVFVMDAWGKDQGVGDKIDMLADGNGKLAESLGLDMDASGFGMGQRSQRYAMVVDDGTVTHLFVEEPGEFRVSSAEYVLGQL